MKIYVVVMLFTLMNLTLLSQEESLSFNGEYQIRPGFNIVVSTKGEEIYVQPTDKPEEKLTKITESLFKIESIDGSIDFSLKLKKGKDYAIVRMYGQTIHAPKLPIVDEKEKWEEIELLENDLKDFDGEYELNDKAKFKVSIDGDALFVQITGQIKNEVYPFEKNKFFYKVVDASIEFVQNDEEVIEYLLLKQNGIIFQADKL